MATCPPQRPGPGPRVVLDGVISTAACLELVAAARALAVVGYRHCVCSATIFDVAAAAPELLPPLVAAREAVRGAVEEALGLPCGLLVEFTGLICWRPGAVIGWHHDANRPYLQQRAYSAVCYLNTSGSDFRGGTFMFQHSLGGGKEGAPLEVHAAPGRVVAYSAQDVHSMTPVTAGERFTLTLWFTEDPAHCEDSRLLEKLAGALPAPPPSTMWVLPDGTDLRLCRLAMAGLGLVCCEQLLLSAAMAEELAEADAEDGGPLRLRLAVQPAVLQAWLAWQATALAADDEAQPVSAPKAAPPAQQVGGEAACISSPAAEATAVLVPGVEFSSMQGAVLAAQHWVMRWGWTASTRERVCSTHLCGERAPGGACCAWLRTCQLSSNTTLQDLPAELGGPAAELQKAASESHEYMAHQQAALDALLPSWLQIGALYHDDLK